MLNQLARPPLAAARPFPVRGSSARQAPAPLVGAGRGASQGAAPVTSYGHPLGSGNRTGLISVTGNFTPDAGTFGGVVDGSTLGATGVDMPGVGATAIPDGTYFLFDFLVKVYLDEFSIDFTTAVPSMGAWGWYGCSDLTNWARAGGNTWNAKTLVTPLSGYPFTGHRYGMWRKEGAGDIYTNDVTTEFTFKAAYGNAA